MSHPMSHPSSPHSSALPSPPSSPGSSFSSLPSSAFSFSVPSSPPRHDSPLPHAMHSLIIPSLSLDTAEAADSCASVPTGEPLGHLKLLVLGSKGSGKTFLAETLVHDNVDIVSAGEWVDVPGLGRVLYAETRAEGASNIKLVEVPGFDQMDDPHEVISPVLDTIHSPFRAVFPLLSPTHPPDVTLRDLLASPTSQFFTAALLLTSSPSTPLENTLLAALSAHIPVIPIVSPSLPHTSRSSSRARTRAPRASIATSSLHPLTPQALRTTLFRRPAALRTLRYEAVERFLWWREIEGTKHRPSTLETLLGSPKGEDIQGHEKGWDWEPHLSRDIALAREDTAGSCSTEYSSQHQPLDPLHVPSLLLFSLSLVRPLRDSIVIELGTRWWTVTVVGAFCAGLGVGWLLNGA